MRTWLHHSCSINIITIWGRRSTSKRTPLYASRYTAVSRKVVGRSAHATIPKGNMGYDQYTVRNDWSCRTYFCCFPLVLTYTTTPSHNFTVSGLRERVGRQLPRNLLLYSLVSYRNTESWSGNSSLPLTHLQVSGKLTTYPSPYSQFCSKWT